jgi:ubiquitin carboxyl-terminal hydrolase 48
VACRHVLEFMVAQNPAEGNQVEMSSLANSHENVTILFTDIVGFTSMSKEVAPHQVRVCVPAPGRLQH